MTLRTRAMSEETNVPILKAVMSILKSIPERSLKTENINHPRRKRSSEALKKQKSEKIENVKTPNNYFDFIVCDNQIFQKMIHCSRRTARIIIEKMRSIPTSMDNTENGLEQNSQPIGKMLLLLLWYLSNEDKEMDDAVGMFELGTTENAYRLLNQGIDHVLKLKADSGLCWPTKKKFTHSAKCFEKRFSFPDVAAVMGHRIIKSKTGHRLLLQTVCNEKYMFIDACVSFDTRPRVVFYHSTLRKTIQELSNGLAIVSEYFDVPNKCKKNLVFPYKESSQEEQAFNRLHELVLNILAEAINLLLKRFPKLKLLDRCEPDIVAAACVLHNYCIKLKDLTPL